MQTSKTKTRGKHSRIRDTHPLSHTNSLSLSLLFVTPSYPPPAFLIPNFDVVFLLWTTILPTPLSQTPSPLASVIVPQKLHSYSHFSLHDTKRLPSEKEPSIP